MTNQDYYENKKKANFDKALQLFNDGFTSAAAQKRSLAYLNSSYEAITSLIQNKLLKLRDDEFKTLSQKSFELLYWNIPHNLHQWSDSKSELFCSFYFFKEVFEIQKLQELRESVKAAEIVKRDKKSDSKREVVLKSIKDMLETQKRQYLRGVSLAEHFNKLDVTVSAHLVTNEHGTTFVRHFFYLFGKLTALNTIIAVAEKHNSKK